MYVDGEYRTDKILYTAGAPPSASSAVLETAGGSKQDGAEGVRPHVGGSATSGPNKRPPRGRRLLHST